jgi:hypothetical protein
MPTSRAFAYNPSLSAPTGATQFGNLAIQSTGWTAGCGGLTWFNGPDEDLGYIIGYPYAGPKTAGSFSQVISGTSVGFRRSQLTDGSFLSTVLKLTNQSFLTASTAKNWLNQNGYYTSYSGGQVVSSGLVFNLQTAPSSGTTWTDSSGNGYNATINGSASYVSNNGGGIRLNNANFSGDAWISIPYNISSNTVTVEIVASFNPTSHWATIWANEVYNTSTGYFAYMPNSTTITFGKPTSTSSITVTAANSIRHWVFVINGTNQRVYLNGTQSGTTGAVVSQTLFGSNNFYFGARHTNAGTGATDRMNNSNSSNYPVFYQMRVYNTALSNVEVTQNFNAIKTTYGL